MLERQETVRLYELLPILLKDIGESQSNILEYMDIRSLSCQG